MLLLVSHSLVFAQIKQIAVDELNFKVLSHENSNYSQKHIFFSDSIVAGKHSLGNVFGQAFAGLLCGAGFSVIPFLTVSSKLGSNEKPNETPLIITITAFTLGSALGVHWAAKSENPKNSYFGSAIASVLGMGIGVGLVYSGIEDPPYVTTVIAALSPIIGSIIYSTAIADWPDENPNITFQPKILSHKDLINNSKVFELEIFKIGL